MRTTQLLGKCSLCFKHRYPKQTKADPTSVLSQDSRKFSFAQKKTVLVDQEISCWITYQWFTYTSVPPPVLSKIRHIQEKNWNYTVIKWKLPLGGLTLVSRSQRVALASVRGKASEFYLLLVENWYINMKVLRKVCLVSTSISKKPKLSRLCEHRFFFPFIFSSLLNNNFL